MARRYEFYVRVAKTKVFQMFFLCLVQSSRHNVIVRTCVSVILAVRVICREVSSP